MNPVTVPPPNDEDAWSEWLAQTARSASASAAPNTHHLHDPHVHPVHIKHHVQGGSDRGFGPQGGTDHVFGPRASHYLGKNDAPFDAPPLPRGNETGSGGGRWQDGRHSPLQSHSSAPTMNHQQHQHSQQLQRHNVGRDRSPPQWRRQPSSSSLASSYANDQPGWNNRRQQPPPAGPRGRKRPGDEYASPHHNKPPPPQDYVIPRKLKQPRSEEYIIPRKDKPPPIEGYVIPRKNKLPLAKEFVIPRKRPPPPSSSKDPVELELLEHPRMDPGRAIPSHGDSGDSAADQPNPKLSGQHSAADPLKRYSGGEGLAIEVEWHRRRESDLPLRGHDGSSDSAANQPSLDLSDQHAPSDPMGHYGGGEGSAIDIDWSHIAKPPEGGALPREIEFPQTQQLRPQHDQHEDSHCSPHGRHSPRDENDTFDESLDHRREFLHPEAATSGLKPAPVSPRTATGPAPPDPRRRRPRPAPRTGATSNATALPPVAPFTHNVPVLADKDISGPSQGIHGRSDARDGGGGAAAGDVGGMVEGNADARAEDRPGDPPDESWIGREVGGSYYPGNSGGGSGSSGGGAVHSPPHVPPLKDGHRNELPRQGIVSGGSAPWKNIGLQGPLAVSVEGVTLGGRGPPRSHESGGVHVRLPLQRPPPPAVARGMSQGPSISPSRDHEPGQHWQSQPQQAHPSMQGAGSLRSDFSHYDVGQVSANAQRQEKPPWLSQHNSSYRDVLSDAISMGGSSGGGERVFQLRQQQQQQQQQQPPPPPQGFHQSMSNSSTNAGNIMTEPPPPGHDPVLWSDGQQRRSAYAQAMHNKRCLGTPAAGNAEHGEHMQRGAPGGGSGNTTPSHEPFAPPPPQQQQQQHPIVHEQPGHGFQAPIRSEQAYQRRGGPGQTFQGSSGHTAMFQAPGGPNCVGQGPNGQGQLFQGPIPGRWGNNGGDDARNVNGSGGGGGPNMLMRQIGEQSISAVGGTGNGTDTSHARVVLPGTLPILLGNSPTVASPTSASPAAKDVALPESKQEQKESRKKLKKMRRKKRRLEEKRALEKEREAKANAVESGGNKGQEENAVGAPAPITKSMLPSNAPAEEAAPPAGQTIDLTKGLDRKASVIPSTATAVAAASHSFGAGADASGSMASVRQRLAPTPLAKLAWSMADMAARFPGLDIPESLTHTIASWVALDTRSIGVVPMLCQSVTEKHTNSEEMEEQEGGEEEQKETTLEEGEKSYHVAEKGKGKRKGPLREGRKSRAGSRGMATDREWEAKVLVPFGIVSERAAESRWAEAFRFVLAPLSMHDTGFSARSATAEDDGSDDDGEGDGDSCNSDHAEGRGRGRGRERGSSASVPEGGEASDEVTMTLPGGLWDAELDGGDPAVDDHEALIHTAVRTAKKTGGVDLRHCSTWMKFCELHHDDHTTVVFLCGGGVQVAEGSQDTLDVATILELIDDRVRRRGNSGNDGDGKKGREFGASFEARLCAELLWGMVSRDWAGVVLDSLRSHAALLEGGRAAAAAGSAVTVEQADCAGMDVNTDMAGIPAARQSDKEGGGLISTMVETSAEVQAAFGLFDLEGVGWVTGDRLEAVLLEAGCRISARYLKSLIRSVCSVAEVGKKWLFEYTRRLTVPPEVKEK